MVMDVIENQLWSGSDDYATPIHRTIRFTICEEADEVTEHNFKMLKKFPHDISKSKEGSSDISIM